MNHFIPPTLDILDLVHLFKTLELTNIDLEASVLVQLHPVVVANPMQYKPHRLNSAPLDNKSWIPLRESVYFSHFGDYLDCCFFEFNHSAHASAFGKEEMLFQNLACPLISWIPLAVHSAPHSILCVPVKNEAQAADLTLEFFSHFSAWSRDKMLDDLLEKFQPSDETWLTLTEEHLMVKFATCLASWLLPEGCEAHHPHKEKPLRIPCSGFSSEKTVELTLDLENRYQLVFKIASLSLPLENGKRLIHELESFDQRQKSLKAVLEKLYRQFYHQWSFEQSESQPAQKALLRLYCALQTREKEFAAMSKMAVEFASLFELINPAKARQPEASPEVAAPLVHQNAFYLTSTGEWEVWFKGKKCPLLFKGKSKHDYDAFYFIQFLLRNEGVESGFGFEDLHRVKEYADLLRMKGKTPSAKNAKMDKSPTAADSLPTPAFQSDIDEQPKSEIEELFELEMARGGVIESAIRELVKFAKSDIQYYLDELKAKLPDLEMKSIKWETDLNSGKLALSGKTILPDLLIILDEWYVVESLLRTLSIVSGVRQAIREYEKLKKWKPILEEMLFVIDPNFDPTYIKNRRRELARPLEKYPPKPGETYKKGINDFIENVVGNDDLRNYLKRVIKCTNKKFICKDPLGETWTLDPL